MTAADRTTDPVLPPMPPSGLRSIDDLLTADELRELHADLAEIARRRRRAEAESAWLVLP